MDEIYTKGNFNLNRGTKQKTGRQNSRLDKGIGEITTIHR